MGIIQNSPVSDLLGDLYNFWVNEILFRIGFVRLVLAGLLIASLFWIRDYWPLFINNDQLRPPERAYQVDPALLPPEISLVQFRVPEYLAAGKGWRVEYTIETLTPPTDPYSITVKARLEGQNYRSPIRVDQVQFEHSLDETWEATSVLTDTVDSQIGTQPISIQVEVAYQLNHETADRVITIRTGFDRPVVIWWQYLHILGLLILAILGIVSQTVPVFKWLKGFLWPNS